jgi:hypothetical protein
LRRRGATGALMSFLNVNYVAAVDGGKHNAGFVNRCAPEICKFPAFGWDDQSGTMAAVPWQTKRQRFAPYSSARSNRPHGYCI